MCKRICAAVLALTIVVSLFAIAPVKAGAAAMTASQQYVDLLKSWEGFSAKPYKDNTHYSIGYGTMCPDNMVDYYTKNPISVEQAEVMLKQQLGNFEKAVNDYATRHGLVFTQNQFDAVVSFTYNCGDSWMRELDGYFNAAVRELDMGAALIYGIGLWSTSAGEYILIRRRMREANMFINGEYGVWPSNYRYVMLDGGAGTVSYKIFCFDTNLKTPLRVQFKSIPTGTDASGKPFAYTLAGWYTADGRKVEVLDASLTNNQKLYARWADPQGNIVTPPAQTVPPEASFPRTAKVVNVNSHVNARAGSSMDAKAEKKVYKGESVTVVEEVTGTAFTATDGSRQTLWCKLNNNLWIPKHYLQYDDNALVSLQLVQPPAETVYLQNASYPRLEGSVLLATYANGYTEAFTPKKKMVSGFDGKKTGTQTVKLNYGGKSVSLQVTVVPRVPDAITSDVYTIDAGMLTGVAPGTTAAQLLQGLNEREYITLFDSTGQVLTGDNPVGTDAMAVIMDGEDFKAMCTVVIRGDVTGDGAIDGQDATLLLQYAAGWDVPVNDLAGDVNGDENCDGSDATLLLQYAAGWDITIAQ